MITAPTPQSHQTQTSKYPNNLVNLNELDNLLKNRTQTISDPIELLVLSACETATGDTRAILGLAGVAIRAGTASVLGTLWAVNDLSTAEFMNNFYQKLQQPNMTKAEALRQTQLDFINQDSKIYHPYFWAPFVLLGNWL